MSRKYKIWDQDKLYFVTFTVIQWLDVFIRRRYKDIFLDSLRYCQKNKGLDLCAYCIMSSHVHLIVGRTGGQPFEGIVRDIKKYTSVKIIEAIKENPFESRKDLFLLLFERAGKDNSNNVRYQFWQQHSHPLKINSNEKAFRFLEYIHNNPVKEGWVLSPEDYLIAVRRIMRDYPTSLWM